MQVSDPTYDLPGISQTVYVIEQFSPAYTPIWFALFAFETESQAKRWMAEHPQARTSRYAHQHRIKTWRCSLLKRWEVRCEQILSS